MRRIGKLPTKVRFAALQGGGGGDLARMRELLQKNREHVLAFKKAMGEFQAKLAAGEVETAKYAATSAHDVWGRLPTEVRDLIGAPNEPLCGSHLAAAIEGREAKKGLQKMLDSEGNYAASMGFKRKPHMSLADMKRWKYGR